LRIAIDELRTDYDSRIAALEQRLAVAEQAQTAVVAPEPRSAGASSAFNPAIGVIFQGQAWNYANDPEEYSVQGFPLGGEAGPFDEGLAIGEAEINISANVDDKFTAWLLVSRLKKRGLRPQRCPQACLRVLADSSPASATSTTSTHIRGTLQISHCLIRLFSAISTSTTVCRSAGLHRQICMLRRVQKCLGVVTTRPQEQTIPDSAVTVYS
jgi:hypothetical protein